MSDKIKETLKDNFDIALETGTTLIGSVLSDTLVGQVAPGVTTAYLSYKQKRAEKNTLILIQGIKERQKEFDERLSMLEDIDLNLFKMKYLPMVMDYVINEPQEEKIKYIINGLVSIVSTEKLQEDFLLTYYDLLSELRLIDILILKDNYECDIKIKYNGNAEDYNVKLKEHREKLKNKISFSDEQISHIEEKLGSKGLYTKLYFQLEEDEFNPKNVTDYGKSFLEFFHIYP